MKFPLFTRLVTIAAVAVAILFPLYLITAKINERSRQAGMVESAFTRDTSDAQDVVGPLLALDCEETVVLERVVKREGKENTITETKTRPCATAYFPPRSLAIKGRVPVEVLHRGIYPIRLYRAALDFAGEFEWPGPPSQEDAVSRTWKGAALVVSVQDARGIKSVSPLAWGAGTLGFVPGGETGEAHFALAAPMGQYATARAAGAIPFQYAIEVIGTKGITFAPVGDSTTIKLTSDWPHPSFVGAFSPDQREVTAKGFEATWKTSHFATGGRAAWQPTFNAGKPRWERVTGVRLVDPVDVYLLSYRATEYGFLFVLFTFAGLALAEATAGLRLHPIQYALVGSALAVFFLLLVALAEHIGFPLAYLSAATACVALLTLYLRHPLGSLARTAAFFGWFVALYGALYGLLRSEDHALLAGSVLVFVVLAAGMLATRRLDWGSLAARLRAPVQSAA